MVGAMTDETGGEAADTQAKAEAKPEAKPDAKTGGGLRGVLAKLALMLGSFLVVVLLLEGGFRLAGYGPSTHLRWFAHPDLHYTAAPNQRGEVQVADKKAGEASVQIAINAHGQRGEDYPLEKPVGEVRIVALGDSLTFGPGVGNEQTYLAVAQQAFRDDPPGKGTLRLVNTAANGYSTWHYQQWVRTQLDTYDPDVLLLCLYIGNDMTISTKHRMFNPVPFPRLVRNSAIGHYLLENNRPLLTRLYKSWYDDPDGTLEPIAPELQRFVNVPEDDLGFDDKMALWRHALTHIAAMKEAADAAGVPLLCLLIPQSHMVSQEGDFPLYTWLARTLDGQGIAVLDPREALRPLGMDGWHSYDPGHFNVAGHAALGRYLADALRARGFGEP